MSKTCGSCRFWGAKRGRGDEAFKVCARIPHDNGYPRLAETDEYDVESALEDQSDAEREAYRTERARTKAVAVDGAGYFAAIRTAEDFGCTVHEEKVTA